MMITIYETRDGFGTGVTRQIEEADGAPVGWQRTEPPMDTRTEADLRRAATPVEVWSYQAQIVMKLTTLGSLGLDGAAVDLTEEATVWDAVTAAVAALEPQPRLVAETQLASAPGFRRDSLLVAQLGPVLGLTDEMIDNMFIAAKAIP